MALSKGKWVDKGKHRPRFKDTGAHGETPLISRIRKTDMGFSIAPLLIHSYAVPARARDALMAASLAPAEHRKTELESAARVLYQETGLDCGDVRELVGLNNSGTCR
jgi:hypothetical protein